MDGMNDSPPYQKGPRDERYFDELAPWEQERLLRHSELAFARALTARIRRAYAGFLPLLLAVATTLLAQWAYTYSESITVPAEWTLSLWIASALTAFAVLIRSFARMRAETLERTLIINAMPSDDMKNGG